MDFIIGLYSILRIMPNYLSEYLPNNYNENKKEQTLNNRPMNVNRMMDFEDESSSDYYTDEEEIDLEYIIENCPPIEILREYMDAQLDSIRGEDEELFMPRKEPKNK